MAAIHVLPQLAGDADVQWQLEALELAMAQGRDLGPRGHHIRALGGSLALLAADLQRMTDDLRTLLDHLVAEGLPPVSLADVDVRTAHLQALLKALASASADYPLACITT